METVADIVEAIRRRIPKALLPLVVALRFRAAWSKSQVRDEAREQMRFLIENTRPDADSAAPAVTPDVTPAVEVVGRPVDERGGPPETGR